MFLIIDINIKVILGIFFFIFNNVNILFAKKKSIQKFYITSKNLSIIKKWELFIRKNLLK